MEKSKIIKLYNCLGEDTIIRTSDGDKKISDIVDTKVEVYEQDNRFNVIKSDASLVLNTDIVDKLIEIELEDGTVLRTTRDHKLRLSDGSYKKACEIISEDIIMEEINIDNVFNLDLWRQFNPVSNDKLVEYFEFVKKSIVSEDDLEYTEGHHILPKSFMRNGLIVYMRPRDHFICHKMLANMFTGKYGIKMKYAFSYMSRGRYRDKYKITPEEYEYSLICRKLAGSPMKGRKFSNIARKHMSENHANFRGTNSPLYGRRGKDCSSYGTVIVHNDNITKRIKKEELDKYLNNGYVMGYTEQAKENIRKTNIGRVHIYKDNEEKSVKMEDLDLYINDGWCIGSVRDRHGENCSTYGKKIINREGIIRFVKEDELNDYLEDGYKLGTGLVIHNKNTMCINDGKNNKFINEENLEYYLDNGYSIGMLREYSKRDKNTLISNPTTGEMKYIAKDDIIPEGFVLGLSSRLKYQCKYKYLFDGNEFYGREEIIKYIRDNTEFKRFSTTTLSKLCRGIEVKGFDLLYGRIEKVSL